MKKELIITIVIAILGIAAGLFLYLWVNAEKELNVKNAIISQNEAAFHSKLELITNENGTLYKKLAFIENINQKLKNDSTALALLTKNQKEKILSLVVSLAHLQMFKDSVLAVQNFSIPTNLVGKNLYFSNDSTKQTFYHYKEIVTLGNPSKNNLTINGTPFSIAVATARDKTGKMSGIVELSPKWVNDFLKIEDVSVSMDVDEYSKYINSNNPFSLNLSFSGGFITMPEVYFLYGVGITINKRHTIEYQKVMEKQIHSIKYSYNIPIW